MPLFVSHRTLRDYKTMPRAKGAWALDSGGFTELSTYGWWETSEPEYVEAVQRYAEEVGKLEWCAPQDWMCEPWITEKTGLTVEEHQRHTVTSYCSLKEQGLPVIPVLQGWELPDYLRCMRYYEEAGVDLEAENTVGLGSVCRRQHTYEITKIVAAIGLSNLHGFGVKQDGICNYGNLLKSADSMAWSIAARNSPPLPGCVHRSCANCIVYALMWRVNLMREIESPKPRLRPGWRPPNQEALAV